MTAPREVQTYFEPSQELIEKYPWEVSLSFMFSRVERAHIMALYCGVVKLHKVDGNLARTAVDGFENRRDDFRNLFAAVYGKKLPDALIKKIETAQQVRNHVLHGKTVESGDFREAIVRIVDYAEGFNQLTTSVAGFRPFGSLQGYKGRAKSLDRSTSRWVLKGIGLPID